MMRELMMPNHSMLSSSDERRYTSQRDAHLMSTTTSALPVLVLSKELTTVLEEHRVRVNDLHGGVLFIEKQAQRGHGWAAVEIINALVVDGARLDFNTDNTRSLTHISISIASRTHISQHTMNSALSW